MSRLNTGAIRRHIHKLLLERFIPKGLAWFSILIIIVLAPYFDKNVEAFINSYPILNLLPIVGGSIHAWLESKKDIDLDDKLAQYISEPDYEGKLGLLHLVDQDIDRALKLILDDSKGFLRRPGYPGNTRSCCGLPTRSSCTGLPGGS